MSDTLMHTQVVGDPEKQFLHSYVTLPFVVTGASNAAALAETEEFTDVVFEAAKEFPNVRVELSIHECAAAMEAGYRMSLMELQEPGSTLPEADGAPQD